MTRLIRDARACIFRLAVLVVRAGGGSRLLPQNWPRAGDLEMALYGRPNSGRPDSRRRRDFEAEKAWAVSWLPCSGGRLRNLSLYGIFLAVSRRIRMIIRRLWRTAP